MGLANVNKFSTFETTMKNIFTPGPMGIFLSLRPGLGAILFQRLHLKHMPIYLY